MLSLPCTINLVVDYSVAGVQVHDARLVAAMRAHGIPQLLTLNHRDFSRFAGITAVHPRGVTLGIAEQ